MRHTDTLELRFERALEAILARVSFSAAAPRTIAVAYSGGLDSTVLLRLAAPHAAARGMRLLAFHVHHGISPNADAWLAHCEGEAQGQGVAFAACRVRLQDAGRDGVEEAARKARYAALGELCRQHGVALLLTAHHLDDQAETVLLQLLRGSGVAGLSGMDAVNTAPALLGDATLLMARPLLGVSRAELAAWAAHAGVAHVDDESNADPRYARNALRHGVMPQLAQDFPGFQARLARSAAHMQAAQRLLRALAQEDLARCAEGACLDLGRLRALDDDRLDNLLRHWLGMHGARMPSTAWLAQMRAQLLDAREDAQLCVKHPDCEIHRHRGLVYLTPKRSAAEVAPLSFRWQGEAWLDFPAYGGRLHFEPADAGLDGAWLRAQDLQIRHRQGGESLRLAANRPSRSLKQHFQALGVPAWERPLLPLVLAARTLLFAAGVGMDSLHLREGQGGCIRLRWQALP